MKRRLALTFVCMAAALAAASRVDPVNRDAHGVAIQGYDMVAYFEEGKPVKGVPAFTHAWMGATWRFATAAHRDRFAADPVRYAPQYGGYCSWAVGHGYTAKVDPEAWKIVNGKLYLNYSKGVQGKWEADAPALIQRGDSNWPSLHK